MTTRSASRASCHWCVGMRAPPLVVGTGTPAVSPHVMKVNGGTPSSVRSSPKTSQAMAVSNMATGSVMSAAIVDRAILQVWQKNGSQRQFCHSCLLSDERMISVMELILLIAFVTALVFAVERHHRR